MEKNKSIIVSGGSKGLGKAIVQSLLVDYPNVNVTVVARGKAGLDSLSDSFDSQYRDRLLTVVGDISEPYTINETIDLALEKWGSIDGMVFNAGVLSPIGHLYNEDYDVNDMKRLFDINFFSVVSFTNELFKRLRIRPGIDAQGKALMDIVIVSSGASVKPYDGWLAYSASKASVNTLCAHLHQELFPIVRSVSVAPGVVDTEMQKEIREKHADSMIPEAHERFTNLHKTKQLLNPSEVGSVYAKLAALGIPADIDGTYVRWNDIKF